MMTATGQPTRRRFSRKRAALGQAFGKPWQHVALEWDARDDLTLAQIAEQWSRMTPGFRFIAQDVSRAIRLAKSERAAERVAA